MKKIATLFSVLYILTSFAQGWVDADNGISTTDPYAFNSAQVYITKNNEKFLLYSDQLSQAEGFYLKKFNEYTKTWDDALPNPFASYLEEVTITEFNNQLIIGCLGYDYPNYSVLTFDGSNIISLGGYFVEDYNNTGTVVANDTELFMIVSSNGETERPIEVLQYSGTPGTWDPKDMVVGSLTSSDEPLKAYITDSDIWVLANTGTAGLDSLDLFKYDIGNSSISLHKELESNTSKLTISGEQQGFPVIGYKYTTTSSNYRFEQVDATGTSTLSEVPSDNVSNLKLSVKNGNIDLIMNEDFGSPKVVLRRWDGATWQNHPNGDVLTGGIGDNFSTPDIFTDPINGRQIVSVNKTFGGFKSNNFEGLQIRMTNELPVSASFTTNNYCESAFGAVLSNDFTVTDADMDSTYIFVNGNTDNTGVLEGTNISFISPAYSPTSTTRTFSIEAAYFAGSGIVNIPIGITDGFDTIVQNIQIEVYSLPTITNNLTGDLELCRNGDLYDLSQVFSPAGGTFLGEGVEDHYFDPSFDFELQGEYNIDYNYTDANGCSNFYSIIPTIFEVDPIMVNSSNSSCSSPDGMADAFVAGQNGPYEYYWSTGATTTSVQNLYPGVYYVNVTDGNNCIAVEQVNIQAINVSIQEAITSPTCFGYDDGAIDLTVTGNGPFEFLWSTGDSTEDLTNLIAGNYFVTITDASGCVSTANYEVMEPGELKFDYSAYDGSCEFGFGGDLSIFNESGGSGTYTYWWSDGSLAGNYNMYVNPGTYQFVLQDDVGCSSDTVYLTTSSTDAPIITGETTNANCNSNDGSIELDINPNGQTVTSIIWNTGATGTTLAGVGPGTYSVVVTNDLGCEAHYSSTIDPIKPLRNDICVVTVDSVSTTNLVVWEPTQTSGIDHYNIYREGPVAGDYIKIGEKSADNLSQFIDLAASPEVRSWRYQISATDECGVEGPQSLHHKTIHVVYTETAGIYTINWDNYEGFDYTTFYLERRDAVNTTWVPVGNGPASSYFTDIDTPPVALGLDYRVSVDVPGTCQAAKANDYNTSRSNRSAGIFAPQDADTLGIYDFGIDYEVSLYPNPATSSFSVAVDGTRIIGLVVRNINGQIVSRETLNNNWINKNISNLASGIYFVEVETEDGKTVHKLMKN